MERNANLGQVVGRNERSQLKIVLFRWAPPDTARLVSADTSITSVRLSMDDSAQKLAIAGLDGSGGVVAVMELGAKQEWECRSGELRLEGDTPFANEGVWGRSKWSHTIRVDEHKALIYGRKSVTTRRTLFSLFGDDVVVEWAARFAPLGE